MEFRDALCTECSFRGVICTECRVEDCPLYRVQDLGVCRVPAEKNPWLRGPYKMAWGARFCRKALCLTHVI